MPSRRRVLERAVPPAVAAGCRSQRPRPSSHRRAYASRRARPSSRPRRQSVESHSSRKAAPHEVEAVWSPTYGASLAFAAAPPVPASRSRRSASRGRSRGSARGLGSRRRHELAQQDWRRGLCRRPGPAARLLDGQRRRARTSGHRLRVEPRDARYGHRARTARDLQELRVRADGRRLGRRVLHDLRDARPAGGSHRRQRACRRRSASCSSRPE